MLVDADGELRWASASDQTAQTVEDGQERLAQGPCAVAFSQRLPAAIRDIRTEPDWAEFARVLVGEGVRAALSVPVELWLIEQAKGVVMGREHVDAQAAFERLRGAAPVLDPAAG
jgi:hypothetical protein